MREDNNRSENDASNHDVADAHTRRLAERKRRRRVKARILNGPSRRTGRSIRKQRKIPRPTYPGLFKRGASSAPTKTGNSGVPDLTFCELSFLSNGGHRRCKSNEEACPHGCQYSSRNSGFPDVPDSRVVPNLENRSRHFNENFRSDTQNLHSPYQENKSCDYGVDPGYYGNMHHTFESPADENTNENPSAFPEISLRETSAKQYHSTTPDLYFRDAPERSYYDSGNPRIYTDSNVIDNYSPLFNCFDSSKSNARAESCVNAPISDQHEGPGRIKSMEFPRIGEMSPFEQLKEETHPESYIGRESQMTPYQYASDNEANSFKQRPSFTFREAAYCFPSDVRFSSSVNDAQQTKHDTIPAEFRNFWWRSKP